MFAPLVLPHTPRLRTLRILVGGTASEDEGRDFAGDREAQRARVREYGRHARSLMRVAFTTAFEWVWVQEGISYDWAIRGTEQTLSELRL